MSMAAARGRRDSMITAGLLGVTLSHPQQYSRIQEPEIWSAKIQGTMVASLGRNGRASTKRTANSTQWGTSNPLRSIAP